MTSSRPYLLRALYEWIVDNHCTPFILVDAHVQGVQVPQQHVNKDGQVVLNISPSAVKGLLINNEGISFNARFAGIPMDIVAPAQGITGIYARENGQGMIFEPEYHPEPPTPDGSSDKGNSVDEKRASLRVVK